MLFSDVTNLMAHGARIARKAGARVNDTNIAGLEWLQQKSKVKILGQIRYTDKAAESTFFNKAAYEYSPRGGAAQDYKKLITKYLKESEA